MPYTTNQLISGAFYSAGIVSREFETVNGSQLNDGLSWLNDILTEKRVDNAMIPYETTFSFNSNAGQEKYWIPDLIQIDTIVFYLNNVRFSMQYSKRNQYFGSGRVEGIESLPYSWYFERQTGGGNLYIYFKPDRDYPIEIHGTFSLSEVSLNQDLEATQPSVNLGIPTISGKVIFAPTVIELPAILEAGALVVNGIDLQGIYDNIGFLTNYINSGVLPGIEATIVNNSLVLTSVSDPPTSITVTTKGMPPDGTRSKGTVSAYSLTPLNAFYSFGIQGTLTSNVNGSLIIDSYTVTLNQRVLVNGQTDGSENGIYSLTDAGSLTTPWILQRVANYSNISDIRVGDYVKYVNPTVSGENYYFIQTNSITNDTRDIIFDTFNLFTFSNFSLIEQPFYKIYNAIGFDRFYITYLRYALADRICVEYNYETSPNIKMQLSKYESWINKKSRLLDLQMQKVSTLQKGAGYSWAYINLGRGFLP